MHDLNLLKPLHKSKRSNKKIILDQIIISFFVAVIVCLIMNGTFHLVQNCLTEKISILKNEIKNLAPKVKKIHEKENQISHQKNIEKIINLWTRLNKNQQIFWEYLTKLPAYELKLKSIDSSKENFEIQIEGSLESTTKWIKKMEENQSICKMNLSTKTIMEQQNITIKFEKCIL